MRIVSLSLCPSLSYILKKPKKFYIVQMRPCMQKSITLITAACHNAVKNLIVLRFVELVFIG